MSSFIIEYDTPDLEQFSTHGRIGGPGPASSTVFKSHPSSTYSVESSQRISTKASTSPTPDDVELTQQPCILRLKKHLSTGGMWIFWEGQHSTYGRVVFKALNCFMTPPVTYDPFDMNEIPIPLDYLETALKEEKMHMENLKGVQGSLVPRYYGFYYSSSRDASDPDYFGITLEYGGDSPRSYVLPRTTVEFRSTLYSAYEQLHLLGIAHRDICGRHLLISKNANNQIVIRLVGLRHAASIDLTNAGDVAELIDEAAQVRTQLGHEKLETLNMLTEVPAYWSKLDNIDDFLSPYIPPKSIASAV